MSEPTDIRWTRPDERDAVLAFITAMGFTPRDAATWDGLGMRAVCAWRGGRLIGAIPVELRPVQVGVGRTLLAAHQTCVAVDPAHRGGGIGSQMQSRLAETLPDAVEIISVYREDPAAAAYQWYLSNGFAPAMHVVSWSTPLDGGSGARGESDPADVIAPDDPVIEALASLWATARRSGWFVDQMRRPLREWLAVHPYRSRYRFEVVRLDERGYAVIGTGRLHGSSERLDVLDLVAAHLADAEILLRRCTDLARDRRLDSVRMALAEHDPVTALARETGMTRRWSFDLLIKPVVAPLDTAGWRYASIDFI